MVITLSEFLTILAFKNFQKFNIGLKLRSEARKYFTTSFSRFWPLKIEKSEEKIYGHNPLRILNHIGYSNFKNI